MYSPQFSLVSFIPVKTILSRSIMRGTEGVTKSKPSLFEFLGSQISFFFTKGQHLRCIPMLFTLKNPKHFVQGIKWQPGIRSAGRLTTINSPSPSAITYKCILLLTLQLIFCYIAFIRLFVIIKIINIVITENRHYHFKTPTKLSTILLLKVANLNR